MGDPKRAQNKFKRPAHPWRRSRIEEEKIILKEFGLKNKKELWKAGSLLKKYQDHAKSLIPLTGESGEKKRADFISKLISTGLLKDGATIDNILSLGVKDALERRLQTLVFRMGMAKSIKQARQFILHNHIFINDRAVNVPSYLVPLSQQSLITYNPTSTLSSPEHPERKIETKEDKKTIKEFAEENKAEDDVVLDITEVDEEEAGVVKE